MSLELHRYGRGPDGFPYILTALPDGYWTPWHVADQQIRRLETRVEELEAGQAVGEAEDLRREVDGLRDLLHRMLEAPTTQVSVTWKDAVRQALGSEAGQPAEPAQPHPPSTEDEMSNTDELFSDYPAITPGRITYAQLRAIIEWQERHKIGDVSLSTLDAYREEGQGAAQAGLELGLIDYGQASGCEDY